MVEPVSRDKFSGTNRDDRENIFFPRSADHEQDWQPYLVAPYSSAESSAAAHTCSDAKTEAKAHVEPGYILNWVWDWVRVLGGRS